MPYRPEHKAETRAKIVEAARRLFNRRGFVDVSIDEIMAEAGLTRGGFYHHFKSKEELFAEAVDSYITCNPAEHWEGIELDFTAPPPAVAPQIVKAYLSPQHLADLNSHCPMIALPSDIARAGPAVRAAYQRLLAGMVGIFEASLPAAPDRRRRALVLATLCIGGMVLARTVEESDLSRELREAAQSFALETGAWEELEEAS